MHILSVSLQYLSHADFASTLLAFGIPADVFWPWFTGVVLLIIGLIKLIKDDLPQRHGLDKILPFGRLFFAMPMGVFGTEHLVDSADIAALVPSWIPAHLFWTYLVGVALIAAALSIILNKYASLAATLMGSMFLVFVALIHIPNIVAAHGARPFWTICLRDISFSGGAFALAGGLWKRTPSDGVPWLVTLSRFLVGIPTIFFGVEDLVHPTLVPGIPLARNTPTWIPGHLFWAYASGVVLVVCGACIVVNKKARLAATYLGIMILLVVLFVYLPILVAYASSIANGLNYFTDTLVLSGAALLLADAINATVSWT
ncbi:MAG TPA: hypothetical protein VN881_12620 [Candidatus Acidoferrales bacterium]|nr:hypothetical protein [Candidatus Acidoferrales bacterium]